MDILFGAFVGEGRPPCRSASASAACEITARSCEGGWVWLDFPAVALSVAFAAMSFLIHFLGLSSLISELLWLLFLPLNLTLCQKNDRWRLEKYFRTYFVNKIDIKRSLLKKIRELVNFNNCRIKNKIVVDLSAIKLAFLDFLFSTLRFVVTLSPRFFPTPFFARRFFGRA